MTTTTSELIRIPTAKDGSVTITAEARATEREIVEERNEIVARLDGTYLHLTNEMKEFQQLWDRGPAYAFIQSAHDGLYAGGAEWLSDQAEMFDADMWNKLGRNIRDAAGAALDRSAIYTAQRYEEIKQQANRHLERPGDTILNWAWWQKEAEQASKQLQAQHEAVVKGATAAVSGAARDILESADMARKIYKHREAILNLPVLIAQGDPRPVQAFVETVLMDIDSELAKKIRYHKDFALVLAIIEDHDSALSYLSYVGLMMEAIPPNFYAYCAGKGGAYLMIELVLLVVTAMLSAGTAVAVRIGMLAARLAAGSAKIAAASRTIRRGKAAIDAVVRMLGELSRAVESLHKIADKIIELRNKGFVFISKTKSTYHAKKQALKRDVKCKVCGSTAHRTPRRRRGQVEYE